MTDQRIEQVSYSSEWSGWFETEKKALAGVLGSGCRQIEHIGSTSVPGMASKPIVDIAVLMLDVVVVPELVEPLANLSYKYMGEFNLPGRHFFVKRTDRQFNLHLVDDRTDHWRKWIKFRNVIRSDENVRRDYMELKRNLALRFADDREKYTDGKSEFVNGIVNDPGRSVRQAFTVSK